MTAVALLTWGAGATMILRSSAPKARFETLEYLNRQFCFQISFLSPAILLLMMCFHGLEYLQTSRTMLQRSAAPAENKKLFWRLFILWTPFCVVIYHFQLFMPLLGLSSDAFRSAVLSLLTIGNLLVYIHYGMDHLIFKFSDSEVRQNIGRLLRRV